MTRVVRCFSPANDTDIAAKIEAGWIPFSAGSGEVWLYLPKEINRP